MDIVFWETKENLKVSNKNIQKQIGYLQ